MDIDTIEEWFPSLVGEEFAFLQREFGFAPTDIECWTGETCVRYAKDNIAVEVRLNYFEGILGTDVVVATPREDQPDIVLDHNMILEARGRKDLWITQDDVGSSIDREHARKLMRQTAANLREYAYDVLRGDLHVVTDVRRLLANVPGDPRFDWWRSGESAE